MGRVHVPRNLSFARWPGPLLGAWNRALLLICLGLAAAACAEPDEELPALRLAVTSDAPPEGVRISRLVLTFRDGSSGQPAPFEGVTYAQQRYTFELSPTVELHRAAYVVDLVPGVLIRGLADVVVQGLDTTRGGERLVAMAAMRVDLGAKVQVGVHLGLVPDGCDLDGDGVPNCGTPGCCPGAVSRFSDCADDDPSVSALAEVPVCKPCQMASDVDCDGVPELCEDADGDGAEDCDPEVDCAPGDGQIFSGGTEICDGIDNDCDGLTDELFVDTDGDGMADCVDADDDDDGTPDEKDCGRTDATRYPGAKEVCNGLDDDCDGKADNGVPACTGWREDWDGDGAVGAADCNPYDARIFAGSRYSGCCDPALQTTLSLEALQRRCDFDCDGVPSLCGSEDADLDGVPDPLDCAPNDPLIHPGAVEKCGDGVDQDCVLGDLACDTVVDADGDGYGASLGAGKPGDCDDSDPNIHPGATEVCNGRDDDCDGVVDGGNPEGGEPCPNPQSAVGLCGAADGAGVRICAHGLKKSGAPDWARAQAGGADVAVICAGYYVPPATESRCDGVDDDCDGETDEDFRWLEPGPGGAHVSLALGAACGLGACAGGKVVCAPDAEDRAREDQTWCDGLAKATPEVEAGCDGLDNDCDGVTDGHTAPIAMTTCRKLGECAAHLTDGTIKAQCVAGEWQCTYGFPTWEEGPETRCDVRDNDCDGQTDEELTFTDDAGQSAPLGAACDGTGGCGTGLVLCAKTGAAVATCSSNPDAGPTSEATDEVCNGVDDDCDGETDEGLLWEGLSLGSPCTAPGVCGAVQGTVVCALGTGAATCSTAWDGPASLAIPETCNGLDDDCDGVTDDVDPSEAPPLGCNANGVCQAAAVACVGGDWVCDLGVTPGYEAVEASCDGLDNDCDGETDEGLQPPVGHCAAWDRGVCAGIVALCDGEAGWACHPELSDGYAEDEPDDPAAAPSGLCDGLDNDCDGKTDEAYADVGGPCSAGTGSCLNAGMRVCGDDQTTVICSVSGKPAGTPCSDANPCTVGDRCTGGAASACVPLSTASCDDGLDCTTDSCAPDGTCVHSPLGETCVVNGKCIEGGAPNPVAPCQLCDPAQSQVTWTPRAEGTSCDDHNACTSDDACTAAGACKGTGLDCDDQLECTQDGCVIDQGVQSCASSLFAGWCLIDGQCVAEGTTRPDDSCQICAPQSATDGWSLRPDGTTCDDGDGCTIAETCQAGSCEGGGAVDCDDQNPCTVDACTTVGGAALCTNTAVPGNPCVDDGLSCTDDVCNLAGDCTHPPKAGTCRVFGQCYSDGQASPQGECRICSPSASQTAFTDLSAGTACADDGKVCTLDQCNGAGACAHPNRTGPCDDGDACTTTACQGGQCVQTATLDCDDQNACTVDSCDPQTGCAHDGAAASGVTCDDGSACTQGDVCQGDAVGTCAGTPLPAGACDDQNPCTADGCSPETGCTHDGTAKGGALCNDGNACTVADQCLGNKAGTCLGTDDSASRCDDQNPCTEDTCDPATGCLNDGTGVADPCDDGNPCTGDDACQGDPAGTCFGSGSGVAEPCDDGDPCTTGDACQGDVAGTCGGAPKDCADLNPCTTDSCAAGQCVHDGTGVTAPCNDQDACTESDACQGDVAGTCGGATVSCDDQNPCTTDVCLPGEGCRNSGVGNTSLCDDGNPCTVSDRCRGDEAGTCEGTCPVPALVFSIQEDTLTLPGGLAVADEDLIRFDLGTSAFSMYFDGSDVGLPASADIDAASLEPGGSLLLSFTGDVDIPGLQGGPDGVAVTKEDLVRFVPVSLGETTSGTWQFALDGSDVGNPNLSGVAALADGTLLIAVQAGFDPPEDALGNLPKGQDKDLYRFHPTSQGATTAGSFELLFDGGDVDLAGGSEKIYGVARLSDTELLLAFKGAAITVTGLTADASDILQFSAQSFGAATSGTWSMAFDGSAVGMTGAVDAVTRVAPGADPACAAQCGP